MSKVSAGVASLVVVVVAAVSGFVGHQLDQHPKVQAVVTKASLEVDKEGTRYLSWLGFSCGVESWSVKILTDFPAADAVDLNPYPTNIPKLVALPANVGGRTSPARAFQLSNTTLIAYKLEPDSDIHLVLKSTIAPFPTMIAEIPSPGCASGSRVFSQIQDSRAAFVAQVGMPQTYFTYPSVPLKVTLVGVGFFDFQHGQTGVAPNGIELHPVIAFKKI